MQAEIEINGEKQTIELDLKSLNLVEGTAVDQIRAQAHAQGAKAKEQEVETFKSQLTEKETALADAQKALDAAKNGGGKTALELEQTRQQMTELQGQIKALSEAREAEARARKDAQIASAISQEAAKHPMREGTNSVFEMMAKAAIQEIDGIIQYKLADGTLGTLTQWTQEWSESAVGKSMLLADTRPGAGTSPADAILKGDSPAERKVEAVKKMGIDKFREGLASRAKTKTG